MTRHVDVTACLFLTLWVVVDSLSADWYQELYNLFHWPGLANSRLVVIGIANTMDLPERLLPKIKSRMGPRISFAPYTYTQLQEIITARLGGLQVFEKQALEFLSRKVCVCYAYSLTLSLNCTHPPTCPYVCLFALSDPNFKPGCCPFVCHFQGF